MLTLLLLFDTSTKYVATILFDFLVNDEQTIHLAHDVYCSMHWSVQKEFEISYNNTETKIQSMNSLDKVPYEKRVLISEAPDSAKSKANDKIKIANSPEGGSKAQQWLDGFLKIPFNKYRSHYIIDELDEFKKSAASLRNKMKQIGGIYESVINCPLETSHHIRDFVSRVCKIHTAVHQDNLSTSLITDANIEDANSRKECAQIVDSSGEDTSLLMDKDVIQLSMFTKFPFLKSRNVANDAYDEKISMINGSFQRTRNYRPISPNVFNDIFTLNSPKSHTTSFTEKSIYTDSNRLCSKWNNYEKDKGLYIESVKTKLDEACFGHDDAKLQIQRLVGQWINGSTDGTVIGIQGPPGNGKTTLAKMGISKCLTDADGTPRPFAMLALGGSSNASTLVGHNFTYVGSTWGKIVDILIEKKCMNPIIYIDEVDKISRTEHGREIAGILTHLTDSTQNDCFEDRYFSGIPLDLSKAIIIMSFNDASVIDPILRDRMHIIRTNPLSTPDKIEIINNYLLPSILDNVGFTRDDIFISSETAKYLIDTYTYEAGVRKLKELLYEIVRDKNLNSICSDCQPVFPFEIKIDYILEVLRRKHKLRIKPIHPKPTIGLINGLYATTAGIGGLTTIEVFKTHSQTFLDLVLTGSQGDVMQESIKCAKTIAWNLLPCDIKSQFRNKAPADEWVHSHNDENGTDSYYNKTTGETVDTKPKSKDTMTPFALHIHTPECGTPKDGPSAGAAITLGILSLLASIPIRNNIAMTGEIDLNGNVTAIGGLQSKIQGAFRAGVNIVLIPLDNKPDLDDIIRDNRIAEITDENVDFTVVVVSHIREMIPHVFVENNINFN